MDPPQFCSRSRPRWQVHPGSLTVFYTQSRFRIKPLGGGMRRKEFLLSPRNGMNCGIGSGGIDGIYSADFIVRWLLVHAHGSLKQFELQVQKGVLIWLT